jgi:DNA-binding MarR family transcriptional regulator
VTAPEARHALGPALRRAWVGYQRRIDDAMAKAGFADRAFPDGRVLRMCRDHPGTTVADIGRELGMTRQGAAKVVTGLRERGYVRVRPSATNGREKHVELTARATEYLAAQRRAARAIERRLRTDLGVQTYDDLFRALDLLAGADDIRMRDYLRQKGVREL